MPARTGSHTRQAAAHKAAQVRHVKEGSNRPSSRGHRSMSRSEAGRKGAEARWGRREEEERGHPASRNHSPAANMSRAEAGRRGAEARWGKREGTVAMHKAKTRAAPGPMSRSEAGKRGAEVRWGYRLDENGERRGVRSQQKTGHMSRSEAGRRGAEARWGPRLEERQEHTPARSQVRGALSRSEAGRRGAEVRWGREENERGGKRRLGRHSQESGLTREAASRRLAQSPWRQNFEDEDELFLEQNARLTRPYAPGRVQAEKKQPKSPWRWVQVFDIDEEEEEDSFLSRQRKLNRLSNQRSRSPWEKDYDLEIDYIEDEEQY